jgi:hypothetical protein
MSLFVLALLVEILVVVLSSMGPKLKPLKFRGQHTPVWVLLGLARPHWSLSSLCLLREGLERYSLGEEAFYTLLLSPYSSSQIPLLSVPLGLSCSLC